MSGAFLLNVQASGADTVLARMVRMVQEAEAIETILEAVKKAGYEPGKDFKIAMDAASSEWKSEKR